MDVSLHDHEDSGAFFEGSLSGSAAGFGFISGRIDRFGCLSVPLSFPFPDIEVLLPDLLPNPLNAIGCDTHIFIDDNDLAFNEGDSDRTRYITVRLTEPADEDVFITYELIPVTATDSGVFADFTQSNMLGTAFIPEDRDRVNIPVIIHGDTENEGDETFRLVINSASFASGQQIFGERDVTITILDNDEPVVGPAVEVLVEALGLLADNAQQPFLSDTLTASIAEDAGTASIQLRAINLLSTDSVTVGWSVVPRDPSSPFNAVNPGETEVPYNGLDDDWCNNENWDCLGNCFCFEGDCGYPDGTDDDAQIRIRTGNDPEITITQDETIDDLSIVRSVSFDTDTDGTLLTVDGVFITALGAGAGGVTVTLSGEMSVLTIFAQGFDAGCLSN
ncbi:MAG: hypothetical protein IID36_13415 [Planctomycetes bacterium]|nr:hypothetical protein [Planctomycetota bacterium]